MLLLLFILLHEKFLQLDWLRTGVFQLNSKYLHVIMKIRACLHGGGAQVGEVTNGGSPQLSCERDQIKMRDYMDRRVTTPKRVTSPTWAPPPSCKQALTKPFVVSSINK